ncbi:MAG: alpha/beta hydrolase [Egibacteraceae bacterium]
MTAEAARVFPGAQAWSAAGGDVGVLLLHGFSGNPVAVRPLGEALAADGFSVELPRLPGHGTRWQDLRHTGWEDWARESLAGLARLQARTRAVVVCGLSMGGALALHVALEAPEAVAGVCVINPMITHLGLVQRLLPLFAPFVRSAPGLGNDIALPGADEKPYDRFPTAALASFFKAQERLRPRLPKLRQPLLVLTSRRDHTVPVVNSLLLCAEAGSAQPRQVWLERSYHVATLDHDAPLIVREVSAFARRLTTAS